VVRLHETQVMHKVQIEKQARPGHIDLKTSERPITDQKHARLGRNGKNLRFFAWYARGTEASCYQYSTSISECDSVSKVSKD